MQCACTTLIPLFLFWMVLLREVLARDPLRRNERSAGGSGATLMRRADTSLDANAESSWRHQVHEVVPHREDPHRGVPHRGVPHRGVPHREL